MHSVRRGKVARAADLPHRTHAQIAEGAEAVGFDAAESARPGRPLRPKMLVPRGEDLVPRGLRPQRQAIGKVTHPAAPYLAESPTVGVLPGTLPRSFLQFDPNGSVRWHLFPVLSNPNQTNSGKP